MPRPAKPKETPEKLEQNRLMWGVFGGDAKVRVDSWDPKAVLVIEAVLAIVASGATVLWRPGSGGGSMGIAIWEGDTRHAPTWLYTAEELDSWAGAVMLRARAVEEAD